MRFFARSLAVLLLFSSASAAPTWWSGTIKQIYPQANGDVVIRLDVDSPSCTSANDPDYFYLRVGENGMTADGMKQIYAAALAAAASKKQVGINFDDASTNCFINRLYVLF